MLIIKEKDIKKFLKDLSREKIVFAPIKGEDDEVRFQRIDSDSFNLSLEYQFTPLSVKKFFLPPKEEIFIFDKKKNEVSFQKGLNKEFVIFGLNLRDIEALIQLDEIMSKPKPDYYYLERRKQAMIIGLINEPGAIPHVGIDLIFEKINSGEYKVWVFSKKGKRIYENNSKFFKEKGNVKTFSVQGDYQRMEDLRKLLLDPELLKDAVEWSWKGWPEIWDKLAKKCLGCGICTYVCPLCYCFSVDDGVDLENESFQRCRYWTSCLLPEFSRISGGHNFHPTLKERYYNWFFHKFVRAYNEYGRSNCVACGRCRNYCPAGIDIEKVILDILKRFKDKNNKEEK